MFLAGDTFFCLCQISSINLNTTVSIINTLFSYYCVMISVVGWLHHINILQLFSMFSLFAGFEKVFKFHLNDASTSWLDVITRPKDVTTSRQHIQTAVASPPVCILTSSDSWTNNWIKYVHKYKHKCLSELYKDCRVAVNQSGCHRVCKRRSCTACRFGLTSL